MLTVQHRARYLNLLRWAARWYADAEGWLALAKGGRPSRYARIAMAAWARYHEGAATPPQPKPGGTLLPAVGAPAAAPPGPPLDAGP